MRLEEAKMILNRISGIPFGELFSLEDINSIERNKGRAGQLLELALGLNLSSRTIDFEDGELKTNKCDALGKPLETIFITQISDIIDDLIQQYPFKKTRLFRKISNILYVPVCKEGKESDWMFLPSIHVDLSSPQFSELFYVWQDDYYSICEQLIFYIENSRDGFIHTSNGKHIQVRSKDSKPYRPIYSHVYERNVSNKNHAFYFRKSFVYDIQKMNR